MPRTKFKQPVIYSNKRDGLENLLKHINWAIQSWTKEPQNKSYKAENIKFFKRYKKRVQDRLRKCKS